MDILEEQKLIDAVAVEVINTQSDYFGETVLITHMAKALDNVWYRALMDYKVSEVDDVYVWFKDSEVELI